MAGVAWRQYTNGGLELRGGYVGRADIRVACSLASMSLFGLLCRVCRTLGIKERKHVVTRVMPCALLHGSGRIGSISMGMGLNNRKGESGRVCGPVAREGSRVKDRGRSRLALYGPEGEGREPCVWISFATWNTNDTPWLQSRFLPCDRRPFNLRWLSDARLVLTE
jgi:hypothetical protein